MIDSDRDTIAAISTPIGVGAIAVIRISGIKALEILKRNTSLRVSPTHRRIYHTIFQNKAIKLDDVLISFFRHPDSYTGEDVVEISCHGGRLIPKAILSAVLESGARLAQPGEFTKRAYLAGKIDLLQAEAVSDIIQTSSIVSQSQSFDLLQGKLSEKLSVLRLKMIDLSTLLEAELDFQNGEVDFLSREDLLVRLKDINAQIDTLLQSYQWGRYNREGFFIPIVGAPNVGKSSLLNTILSRDRAIVSPLPGTTRDYLEEPLNLDGMLVRLADTAGLRHSNDQIESFAVEKTIEMINRSQVVVFVADLTNPASLGEIKNIPEDKPVIMVWNKIDLIPDGSPTEYPNYQKQAIHVSAKTGKNIPDLLNLLQNVIQENYRGEFSVCITRERHWRALVDTKAAVMRSISESEAYPDVIAANLWEAVQHLKTLTGEISTDDILNNIFNEFCIGK